jgi:5-methylcytosine-specific restriction endonuclease McrA
MHAVLSLREAQQLGKERAVGRISLSHLFKRSDQSLAQQHKAMEVESEVRPSPESVALGSSSTYAIAQDVKIEVAERDGGRCLQCGSNKELYFDHAIPWSKGKANITDNIQLLCGNCNRGKGADDIPATPPPTPRR